VLKGYIPAAGGTSSDVSRGWVYTLTADPTATLGIPQECWLESARCNVGCAPPTLRVGGCQREGHCQCDEEQPAGRSVTDDRLFTAPRDNVI